MTTDITELAQSLKAAAEKASNGDWVKESGDGWEACCSANDQANGGFIIAHFVGPDAAENREFVQAANPANILALVEALGMEAYWKVQCRGITDHCEVLQARIAELESRTVKLPDDEDGQAYGFGKWSNSKLPATAGTMTIAYCEDAWRAAFKVFSSAAGIKVEAE